MRKVLSKSFFDRPTLTVAEELLGKFLVRDGKAFMITEVEAYDGFQDKASHASRVETPRNNVMFGRAGVWYVYLVYGMHHMLSIVTREEKYPAAVLIRGVEGFNGPAKLTKALNIDRNMNEKPANKKIGLWIEDRGVEISKKQIQRTPSIGVDYAGEVWMKKKWRFIVIRNNE